MGPSAGPIRGLGIFVEFPLAKWGRWVGAFSSRLTLKGLHLFAALDSSMPVEFPEDEDEGESEDEENKDVKPSTELLNVLTLQTAVQCKVANKCEFAAKSAEAYALLYEAATQNVQIQRAMKKHKQGQLPACLRRGILLRDGQPQDGGTRDPQGATRSCLPRSASVPMLVLCAGSSHSPTQTTATSSCSAPTMS